MELSDRVTSLLVSRIKLTSQDAAGATIYPVVICIYLRNQLRGFMFTERINLFCIDELLTFDCDDLFYINPGTDKPGFLFKKGRVPLSQMFKLSKLSKFD